MDYREIDSELVAINRKLSLLPKLKPVNLKQEKDKFFKNFDYNPQFKYPKIKLNLKLFKEKLNHLKIDQSFLGIIFEKKRQELLNKIKLITNIGSESFSQDSINLFGSPDQELVKLAENQLQKILKKFSKVEKISSRQVKAYFERILKEYNLKNWRVELKNNLISDCYTGRSSILIKKIARFSKERIERLAAHEIETHILRRENGKCQPYKIFREGLAGYISTEEGLATYNEERAAKSIIKKDFWSSAYVFAVNQAQKTSFRQVFNALRDYHFSPERAWIITLKAKRGLEYTSMPGGFTKDYLYFSEKNKISKYLNQGGNLSSLYIGKIGINDLSLMNKISGLRPPTYLPNYLKNQK